MKLSENFSLTEFTKSQTASRKGIENNPSPVEIENLKALCVNVLEKVRTHFGMPVTINSGYRCLKLNKAIGGARNSQHMTGCAADIEISGIDNQQLFDWIKFNLQFDQLILEYVKPDVLGSGWVHVSWSTKNRQQAITIG